MKIVGFMALHYNKIHLPFAIRSILPSIDELWIAYSPVGSHGARSEQPCPDTRQELFEIAAETAGDKLRWREGLWDYEGQQRDMIYEWCPDADLIFVIDSDEIWPANLAGMVMGQVLASRARAHRLPMIHFYRDLHHAVLNDVAFPVRAICPWKKRQNTPEVTLSQLPPICHLGYAIPPALMEYKLRIHGHRGEMRWTPENYVQQVYTNPNRWKDVHPTNVNYWDMSEVHPEIYLPPWVLNEHPYMSRSAIDEIDERTQS